METAQVPLNSGTATHCDKDIKNEPNIISIKIISMWVVLCAKMIPHQHQQQLLQDDGEHPLMSTAQHGAHCKSLYVPCEAYIALLRKLRDFANTSVNSLNSGQFSFYIQTQLCNFVTSAVQTNSC